MREFIIQKLKTLKINNEDILIKYVDFCLNNAEKYIPHKTALHHILPRAKTLPFKDYSNLNNNKWNGVYLTFKNHYLAHYLLALSVDEHAPISAFIGMHNKDILLKRINEDVLINSDEYNKILVRRSEQISILNSNKVVAKNLLTGKNVKVSKEEFDSNPDLVGATIGKGGEHLRDKIPVINRKTNTKMIINKSDFDPELYFGHTKGKTIFKDKDNNVVFTFVNDPRVLSGELIGLMKNVQSKLKGTKQPGQRVRINIYDSNDNLMFECYGNFKKTCIENDLPGGLLTKTIKNDDYIKFDLTGKRSCDITKLKNSKKWKFEGWYARKIKKSKLMEKS